MTEIGLKSNNDVMDCINNQNEYEKKNECSIADTKIQHTEIGENSQVEKEDIWKDFMLQKMETGTKLRDLKNFKNLENIFFDEQFDKMNMECKRKAQETHDIFSEKRRKKGTLDINCIFDNVSMHLKSKSPPLFHSAKSLLEMLISIYSEDFPGCLDSDAVNNLFETMIQ